ncbi:MAG TPA: M20/M25/M40 family metallo-hydrolase [Thermodesulfobacteriota bacterium]|nr:M20/M25/M40 family metallo-hydrolase [Thermodesulfobacteriota bacterium]
MPDHILSLSSGVLRLIFLFLVLALLCIWGWSSMIRMPGRSYSGTLSPLSAKEMDLSKTLRSDVEMLAGQIGVRNLYRLHSLAQAANFIEGRFKESGYTVRRETFECEEKPCRNLIVEVRGTHRLEEIVLIGAHYDSAGDSPGANDNATGVAALLALAHAFSKEKPARTLRFVAFTNEEPPFFKSDCMGSRVHAKGCRKRKEKVIAMFSLETMGYYSDTRSTQIYPPPMSLFYPSTGNFIAFVGNLSCRGLLREVIASFRRNALFPSEGAALPSWIPGVDWSDHWSFWKEDYPAVMITDTAPFRYPDYHSISDTPDNIDYDRLARVVTGLEKVIREIVVK